MMTWPRELERALRSLVRTPVSTAAAVLVVALGTGIQLAVAAFAWSVALRSLPVEDQQDLVLVVVESYDGIRTGVDLANVDRWREELRSLSGLAAFRVDEKVVRAGKSARVARLARVTSDFFEVLGGGPDEAVRVLFARQPDGVILDRRFSVEADSIDIAGEAGRIVGAVQDEFPLPAADIDLWYRVEPRADGPLRPGFVLLGRLRPGVPPEEADRDVQRAFRELEGPLVGVGQGPRARVVSLDAELTGKLRPVLRILGIAAFLVLLVTAGNLGVLLLGRAVVGGRQAAIRRALGARAWHVVRGTLAEASCLAVSGTLLGAWGASLLLRVVVPLARGNLPLPEVSIVQAPILGFGLVILASVTLIGGSAPALHLARRGEASLCQTMHKASRHRVLSGLVVLQIAVAIVLGSTAWTLVGSVESLLESAARTSSPDQVLVGELRFEERATTDPHGVRRTVAELVREIEGWPGVTAVGVGSALPPARKPFQIFVRLLIGDSDVTQRMSVVAATPGYLSALGVRTLEGRHDPRAAPVPEIVISESTARFYRDDGWMGVGTPLSRDLPPFVRFESRPVVAGIVGDTSYSGLDRPADAAIYVDWSLLPSARAALLVEVDGDPRPLAESLRGLVRHLDPGLPLPTFRTLEDERRDSIALQRLPVIPITALALIALLVAAVGNLGLFSRLAEERRLETAVRLALGARPEQILGAALRRGLFLACGGILLGCAGVGLVGPGLETFLHGVSGADPATVVRVVALVVFVMLAAVWLPARRASRIDPVRWLRAD